MIRTLEAATILVAAFLSFVVQPMIAKLVLPWFGGGAAVWSVALVFFQVGLLAGYLYAHVVTRWLPGRAQALVHVGLLAAACALLPIVPSPAWRATGAEDPAPRMLGLLLTTIGLQYALLTATGPLVQAWSVRRSGRPPYRFFALGNLGSLLGLLAFPLLIEPRVSLHDQTLAWSIGFAICALACIVVAWHSRRAPVLAAVAPAAALGVGWPWWLALAAIPSLLLVAVTNHMTRNLAPIPILWVLPLSLYLVSFIAVFASDRVYRRAIWFPLLAVALALMARHVQHASGLEVGWLLAVYAGGFFVCCMVCHGELARRRPAPRLLTSYYLAIACGGALGGGFAALVAPRIFVTALELPIGLIGGALLVLLAAWSALRWWSRGGAVVGLAALAWLLVRGELDDRFGTRAIARSPFGVLRVDNAVDEQGVRVIELLNNSIAHGTQYLDRAHTMDPTAYYGATAGVGRALHAAQARGPIRAGVIGLGAGVLATYADDGDVFRFYELDPVVVELAQREFTFLHNAPAAEVVIGDGRILLEREPDQGFDVLVVDAFSGDSVPIHLLTAEAFALYRRHLAADGILALHVSNQYLDLTPVCAAGARLLGRSAVVIHDRQPEHSYLSTSTWVLILAPHWLDEPSFAGADIEPAVIPAGFKAWTDDYSDLLEVLE